MSAESLRRYADRPCPVADDHRRLDALTRDQLMDVFLFLRIQRLAAEDDG